MASLLASGVRRWAACGGIALCVALAACGGSSPSGPSPTAPRVTAVTPNQGSSLGGTKITISGANFAAGAAVSMGGAIATNISIQDTNTLTATTPAHVAGTADVTVTVNGQAGVLRGGFTYVIEQVTNQPPTLTSLVVQGTRANEPSQFADIDEAVKVTATVQDNETPVSSLIFDWSADAGSFSGTGPTVTYTAPHSAGQVTLRLKITERYTAPDASGLPVQKENTTFGTTLVDVHDSIGEIGAMSRQFLLDFSDSTITDASFVVRNFITGCGAGGTGKQNEQSDVQENRDTFRINSSSVSSSPRVTVNFSSVCPFRNRLADACSAVDVSWNSTCLVVNTNKGCTYVGQTESVKGVDWVTAHYDPPSKRWWLCDSDFDASSGTLKIMR